MQRQNFSVPSRDELNQQFESSKERVQELKARNLTQHRRDESMQFYALQIELNEIPQRCIDTLSSLPCNERPNLSDQRFDLNIATDQIKCICSDGQGFLSRVHDYGGKKVVHHDGCKLLEDDVKMKYKRRYLDDTTQVLVAPHWIYPGNKFPKQFNAAREEMKRDYLLKDDGNYNPEYLIINDNDNNNNNAELEDEKKESIPDWCPELQYPANDEFTAINRCMTFCQTAEFDQHGQVSIVYYNKRSKSGFCLIQTKKSLTASINESKILKAIDGGNYIVKLIAVEGVQDKFHSNIIEYGDIDIVGLQQLLSMDWNCLYSTSKKLLYELCSGLQCLYQYGLIHTGIDLTTIGIFGGYFKIRDMSAVISYGDNVGDVDPKTAPPELIQKKIIKRTIEYDVDNKYHSWSVGVLLYAFLTGFAPIAIPTNGSPMNVEDLFRIYADQVRLAVLGVDRWVIDIITDLLEIEPENRISCAAVLENASLAHEIPSFPTTLHEIGYRFSSIPNTETFECKKILKNGDIVTNPYI